MHVPTAEELAAIATVYLALTPNDRDATQAVETSRWRLAGRLCTFDAEGTRLVARSRKRWSAASRFDA